MGKGFNNYMCKKFFHPASRDNLKRVWMAEQVADSYKKKQEELRIQYEKEQDLYTNKALLSKESKDKLSVNFMYEPPPGTKKEREREDYEPEYKFEWQRKFNAPREDYCKGDSEIRDQPFGIQVRNVRCIKCHKWGHINTDRECPMYNQSSSSDPAGPGVNPSFLLHQMKEDGLAIKRSALTSQQHINFTVSRNFVESEDESDEETKKEEINFLKSLSTKQKQKLLKKLEKLEKKNMTEKKSKKLKKSKEKKQHGSSDEEKETKHSRKKISKTKYEDEKSKYKHNSAVDKERDHFSGKRSSSQSDLSDNEQHHKRHKSSSSQRLFSSRKEYGNKKSSETHKSKKYR